MSETIGTAYIQIEPSFRGVSSQISKEMGDAGVTSGNSFGSGFAKVLGTTGKTVAGVVAGTTAAIGAMGTAFISATNDVASYGDNIDKMSQKIGISAEAYQEWGAVLQHSGASVDSLQMVMKTLSTAVETDSDAFAQLGLNLEDLKGMSNEDIFSSVIFALQGMEEGTERTYLATQLLGRGATEFGALLNTSAEDTQAMIDTVHELGGVMSDEAVKASASYQDQLQDLSTAFEGLKNNLISEFLPSITEVMGGLTDLFSGNYDQAAEKIADGISSALDGITSHLPDVMNTGLTIVEALASSILENLPAVLETGISVIEKLSEGIIENLPLVLQTVISLVSSVLSGLMEAIPTLIPLVVEGVMSLVTQLTSQLPTILNAVLDLVITLVDAILNDGLPLFLEMLPDLILGVVDFLISSIPQVINAVITIITAIVEAFPTIIAKLVEAIPEIIVGIITALLTAIPQLVMAGIQLFISLIAALPQIIIEIVKAIPEIITGIVKGLKENWPQIKEAGKELLTQIMEGLTNIGSKISNAVKKIWNALKEKFTEMSYNAVKWGADMLSNFIEGIKSKISAVTDAVKNVAETVKNFLGFSEPEEGPLSNFHTYAPDMMKLFAQGIEDNEDMLKATVTEAFDFQGSIESGYATPEDNSNYEETIVSLLQTIAERSGVQIDVNSEGLFNIMRSKNYEYSKRTGRSAFV